MGIVKRISKNLKYSPRRKLNLDATSFGPTLKLVVALFLFAAFVLLVVFGVVPFVKAKLTSGAPLFGGTTPASQSANVTAAPFNPILTNEVKTVQYGEGYGLPTAVVDPSVFGDEILFATGASESACNRLVRLNPATGAFVNIDIKLVNNTIRYPLENETSILYADCKTAGGGNIMKMDKATGDVTVLSEFAMEAPRLSLEAPYAIWTERTDETTAKLEVCDITSGEQLTLAVFTNSPYAQSDPSIKSGQVIYADEDTAKPGNSLIRTILLADSSRWDFTAGSFVHDPKSAGDRWAYLSGNHDGDSDLYVSIGGAAPTRVARGVVDFDITPSCVVFSRDETVYAYVFSDNKTYVLSETGTNAQFVMAGGDYAIWRDMTDPTLPLWKYIKVVG